ncbi:MAG: DUF2924 domain-containing protein [Terriglobales bacterium]
MPDPIVDRLANLMKLSRASLVELWEQLFQTSPHPRLRRDLMVRILAHRLQEQAYGGIAPEYRRRLQRLARAMETEKDVRGSRLSIKPGTRLVRQWQSRTHIVQVAERGYEYDGSCYDNLSEIARLITGTRRSGPLFFGLKEKQRLRSEVA